MAEKPLNEETISNQFKNPDLGDSSIGQAKYSYFLRLASIGLVFAVGLSTPLSYAQARTSLFPFFKNEKQDITTDSVISQNSQTIPFLEAAINLDPNPARGGGDIVVIDDTALLPEIGPSGTIADIELSGHQGKISIYTVRSGDTIAQVAKMFEVSPETILWANDLPRGATLRIGQTLVILPIDGIQHTVKKGDTLKNIAKKYNGDIEEILEFNNINADGKLSIGDVIIIPNGKETVSTFREDLVKNGNKVKISNIPSYDGYYSHPIPTGRKTQGVHGYNGVDYGAPIGTAVYASASGTVIISKFKSASNAWFGGYGNYIVIEHANGTQTLYAHLSSVYIPVGGRIEKGQPIGEVGNTGKSTGPHLHFEVRGAKNPF